MPEKSLLLKAVSQVGDLKMPPKKHLTPEQIADLTRGSRMARRGRPIRSSSRWASPIQNTISCGKSIGVAAASGCEGATGR